MVPIGGLLTLCASSKCSGAPHLRLRHMQHSTQNDRFLFREPVVPRESNGFAPSLNHSPPSSNQHTEEMNCLKVPGEFAIELLRESMHCCASLPQLFRSPWPGATKLRKNGQNAEAYCTPVARERWLPRSCLLTSLLRCC